MAATWNDANIPYGAPTLSINSVSYITESFEVNRPTQQIQRRNGDNEPSGSVGIADFVTGTATLQKITSGTAIPLIGLTFAYTDDSGVGAETYFITEVSQPRSQGDATKFNISFQKKYN
jgi:hypothetical protein